VVAHHDRGVERGEVDRLPEAVGVDAQQALVRCEAACVDVRRPVVYQRDAPAESGGESCNRNRVGSGAAQQQRRPAFDRRPARRG
jgi:hypothetical protein